MALITFGASIDSDADVDISALAAGDWTVYKSGPNPHFPAEQKSGGGGTVGNLTSTGGISAYEGDTRAVSWTGGTPDAVGSSVDVVFASDGVAGSISVVLPAGTATRTAYVLFTHYDGQTIRCTVTLSDGSAGPSFTTVAGSTPNGNDSNGIFIFDYAAGSDGQTATVTVTLDAVYSGDAIVGIQAAGWGLAASGPTPVSATPAGVAASWAVGAAVASGAARSSPAGLAAAWAIGAPVARGAAAISVSGLAAAWSASTALASGGARALPSGLAALWGVGQATALGGSSVPGVAAPGGVAATWSIGAPGAMGAARSTPAGQGAAWAIGATPALGAAGAAPIGVMGAWSVGQALAVGGISIPGIAAPPGVTGLWAVGIASAAAVPSFTFAYSDRVFELPAEDRYVDLDFEDRFVELAFEDRFVDL